MTDTELIDRICQEVRRIGLELADIYECEEPIEQANQTVDAIRALAAERQS